MFNRLFKKPAPATTAPDRAYVKDSYTQKVIYTGTVAACQRYVSTFGLCYVEAF